MKKKEYIFIIILLPILYILLCKTAFKEFGIGIDVRKLFEEAYNRKITDDEFGRLKYLNRSFFKIVGNNRKGNEIINFINEYVYDIKDDYKYSFNISLYSNDIIIEKTDTVAMLKKIIQNIHNDDLYNVYLSKNTSSYDYEIYEELIITSNDYNVSNIEILGKPSLYDLAYRNVSITKHDDIPPLFIFSTVAFIIGEITIIVDFYMNTKRKK